MPDLILFRKRLIPDECILLKDDEILHFSDTEHILVTKWRALKSRKDLHHGYSCYFYDKGFKISKFYREDGSLLYWYCDIIDAAYPAHHPGRDEAKDPSAQQPGVFIATDLLADVIVYPDGFVKVVDLDELDTALQQGFLDTATLGKALRSLNALLQLIYNGGFKALQDYLETFETR